MKQVPERLDFSLVGTSLFVKLTLMQRLIMVDMFCISEAFLFSKEHNTAGNIDLLQFGI